MKNSYACVISSEVPAKIKEKLSADFKLIVLPPDKSISKPTSSHPDMLINTIGKNLITPEKYYLDAKSEIDEIAYYGDLNVITTASPRSAKYPEDIAVNSLICGKYLFSLIKHTAPEILSVAEALGYSVSNVKQGYAACSTLSLSDALITADSSIKKAADSRGLPVLQISPGYIDLKGYNEGFIGGASGVCEDTVYFFGSPDFHPDGEKIKEFLYSRNKKYVALYDGALADFGGIKFAKSGPREKPSMISCKNVI